MSVSLDHEIKINMIDVRVGGFHVQFNPTIEKSI